MIDLLHVMFFNVIIENVNVNFDVIDLIIIVVHVIVDVIKNITNNFEIIIVDVKINIDINFEFIFIIIIIVINLFQKCFLKQCNEKNFAINNYFVIVSIQIKFLF